MHHLRKVTEDTPEDELRSLDKNKEGIYPIFLISDEYGIRGIDYRAPNNPLGICMLICSPFPNKRTRIQAMKRICRYTDVGNYV